jgi:uncharacterized protein
MPANCLIIFTRYPEAGKSKTRLIPALGADGAALLHQQMAEYTVEQANCLQQILAVDIEVWFVGGDLDLMTAWLGNDLVVQQQPTGDLGDRMCAAMKSAFSKGYQAVVIVGTDCPDLDASLLAQSFRALQHHQLAIGPAIDGGYYLIGLQSLVPELFVGIHWSTATVLQETLEIADQLDLKPLLLPCLPDIDVPQDLDYLAGKNWLFLE